MARYTLDGEVPPLKVKLAPTGLSQSAQGIHLPYVLFEVMSTSSTEYGGTIKNLKALHG